MYLLIHATRYICYVVRDVQPRPMPWEGTTVVYNAGGPLGYSGQEEMPPYVQDFVSAHFAKLREPGTTYPEHNDMPIPLPEEQLPPESRDEA